MMQILTDAKECWDQLSTFRRKRNRCRDYTYGRQWNDLIEVDGRTMTEYEYILREGNVPLKNNLIRRIVRNVIGVFRSKLPDLMKTVYKDELSGVAAENSMEELFCRSIEEFLISGMAIHRKRIGIYAGHPGVWTEIVSPGSFFFNADSRDVRGRDIDMVGQVHRVGFNEWVKAFVKTRDDFKKAAVIFGDGRRKLNVTEVWRREMVGRTLVHDFKKGRLLKFHDKPDEEVGKTRYNGGKFRSKWIMEEVWKYYFLTDDGEELLSGDSPYIDGGHPYIMKCYPYLDGEIQSFVGDLIDQQRYTNRLITLYDWVIRASAKGVLLLPEGAVDHSNMRNVADQWGRFNGVIVYKSDPLRPEPKQINSNMSNLGISELLEIQLKMMEDVSGVNGILQGNTNGGNVSGTLYNSQTTNAMYSLADLLETYMGFIRDCAAKDRLLLRQTQGSPADIKR